MLKALVLFLISSRYGDYKITKETESEVEIFNGNPDGLYDSLLISIQGGNLVMEGACVTLDTLTGKQWFSDYEYTCPASEAGILAMLKDWEAEESEHLMEQQQEAARIASLTPEQMKEEVQLKTAAWAYHHMP